MSIVIDQLLDELVERSEVLVSDNTWEPIAEQRLAEDHKALAEQGKTLEDQVKENGMTVEELRENYRHKAKTEVLRAMVIREVFQQEDLKVEPKDLEEALMDMSNETGLEPKELWEELQKQRATQELHYRAIARKVREHLVSKAEIKEAVGAGA